MLVPITLSAALVKMTGKFQQTQHWTLQDGAGRPLPGESQGCLLGPQRENQVSPDRITVWVYELARLTLFLSLELGNISLRKTQ